MPNGEPIMLLRGLNDAYSSGPPGDVYQHAFNAEYIGNTSHNPYIGNMANPRKKLLRFFKIMIIISLLASLFVFVRLNFLKEDHFLANLGFSFFTSSYRIGNTVKMKLSDNTLSFMDSVYDKRLIVKFTGSVLNVKPDSDSCAKILNGGDAVYNNKFAADADPFKLSICLKWKETTLIVNDTRSDGSHCHTLVWTTDKGTPLPTNCFSLTGAHWYGGSLLKDQQWPLEDVSVQMQPFISSHHSVFFQKPSGSYGSVLEKMWINSLGFGIIVQSEELIDVSVNESKSGQLCLKSHHHPSESLNTNKRDSLFLKYTVCMDRTAKLVHRYMIRNFIMLPKAAPDEALMQNPVWSTRGINMENLTQAQVFSLQTSIKKHSFPHSQLHIAGNYTRTLGGLFFDHTRFTHSSQMVSEMTGAGFQVSTSILPVVEEGSQDFKNGMEKNVFVDIPQKQFLLWKNKSVALIDFTKPAARTWMTQRLTDFRKEIPVKAFHFNIGEATLLFGEEQAAVTNDYSKYYGKFAQSMGNNSVVDTAYQTQQYALMVDIGARSSSWGYELGLQSIIPSVLTVGLLGYPFVLVGPVGGVPVQRFQPDSNSFAIPDEELYARWFQLSVFLPGLEISVGPWQYNNKVADMAHRLLKRRAEQIFPILQTAVKEFLRIGAPIIRPVWWIAEEDETAQRIDCEFLVSNKILVAPVLETGARQRSVYLPLIKGLQWKDDLRGKIYPGGQWLHNYQVDLYEVATFRPYASKKP